jgi:hypothetical protein
VLGTDNTGAEGDVFLWKNATVGGNMFVLNNLSASQGLTVSGVDVLTELANKQPTLSGSSVVSVSRLTATNEVVSDSIRASTANAVTCADNLVVTGSLTVSGFNVLDAISNAEPAFSVESPLVKDYDFNTGVSTLRLETTGLGGINPIFCGGRVDGATASPLSSVGRVGYTVSRPSGQGTGVWTITFDTPYPNNDYTVQLTMMLFGSCYLWDQMPPTANGFTAVLVNNAWNLRNAPFHFTILG